MNHLKSRHYLLLTFAMIISACQPSQQKDAAGDFTGYVEANYYYISAPTAGWITALLVKEGEALTIDATVAQLDRDYQELSLEQAKLKQNIASAEYDNITKGARPEELSAQQKLLEQKQIAEHYAINESKRIETLHANNLASAAEAEKAKAVRDELTAAVASLKESIKVMTLGARPDILESKQTALQAAHVDVGKAYWALTQRTIPAKQAGVVEQVFMREGEYVQAGQPIVSVFIPESKKVRFYVEQSRLSELRVGQLVDVFVDGQSKVFTAKIRFIAKQPEFTPPVLYNKGSRDSLVFMVEANFTADTTINVGQPVDIQLHD